MPVTPNAENTFTIVRRPLKESERKTLERLMTMQKDVQRGRTKLAERRSREFDDEREHDARRNGELAQVRYDG